MSQESQRAGGSGPLHDRVELWVAITIILFGAVVIYGSLKVGIGWGIEGPRAGFFPFYIGILIAISGIVTFAQTWLRRSDKNFATWSQLSQVLSVVVPATIYVLIIPWIGIYIASMMLIAAFMRRLGRYRWGVVAAVSLGVPLVTFVVFERWFLVPLPKGPVEEWLGF